MKRILMASALVGAFVAWAVPAVAGEADAPPPPSAASTACCCPERVCCERGWTVSGSALLLKVRRTDTAYALVDTDGQIPLGDGGIRELDFDYGLGFRSGISWATGGPCCWDFGVTGTYLSTDVDDSVALIQPGLLFPEGSITSGSTAQSAAASLDEKYVVVDLDVGHTFCGPCLEARVFGGLRFASIDEDASRSYVTAPGMGPGFTISAEESTSLTAFGIHAGVEPRWRICRGFSLYGRLGAGILFGSFDWSHDERNSQQPGILFAFDKSLEQDLTVIEGALGVSWECDRLFGSCIGLRVSAGIEHTRWDFVDFKVGPNSLNINIDDSAYSVGGFFLAVDLLF